MTPTRKDLIAAIAVTFLAVPQAMAVALVAGLPPIVGLYGAAIPVIIGSLARSSRHVVVGPTNSISLLVGGAIAVSASPNPWAAAGALALLIGLLQIGAGALRLGALVDYISASVVLGYITGVAVLIGVSQLGPIIGSFDHPNTPSMLIAGVTLATLVTLQWRAPKVPGAVVALVGSVSLTYLVDLQGMGVRLARDLAPIPRGLPPLTLPDVSQLDLGLLLPVALAGTVLSLVESSAVGRDIASRTGQRIDTNREFIGQGLANAAAGLFGGYPLGGSLARSALNERLGAETRWGGALSGVAMLGVLLLLGPVVDRVPIPTLAAILVYVAARLLQPRALLNVLKSTWGDRIALVGTILGAWTLSLERAIYLGVGLSIVLFLQRARNLRVEPLRLIHGRLQVADDDDDDDGWSYPPIAVLHVEGSLFFGAANELRDALDEVLRDDAIQVLILRVKRTNGLDYTTVAVLEAVHGKMRDRGGKLLLVGMRDHAMGIIERSGAADVIGRHHLYPTQAGWFVAMDQALAHALEVVGDDDASAPLREYLRRRGR